MRRDIHQFTESEVIPSAHLGWTFSRLEGERGWRQVCQCQEDTSLLLNETFERILAVAVNTVCSELYPVTWDTFSLQPDHSPLQLCSVCLTFKEIKVCYQSGATGLLSRSSWKYFGEQNIKQTVAYSFLGHIDIFFFFTTTSPDAVNKGEKAW